MIGWWSATTFVQRRLEIWLKVFMIDTCSSSSLNLGPTHAERDNGQ